MEKGNCNNEIDDKRISKNAVLTVSLSILVAIACMSYANMRSSQQQSFAPVSEKENEMLESLQRQPKLKVEHGSNFDLDSFVNVDCDVSVNANILKNDDAEIQGKLGSKAQDLRQHQHHQPRLIKARTPQHPLTALENIFSNSGSGFCAPEDVNDISKHFLPYIPNGLRNDKVKNGRDKDETVRDQDFVVYLAVGLLLASLAAALFDLFKVKRQQVEASKGAAAADAGGKKSKAQLLKRCSLADLTMLRHSRKESLRKESNPSMDGHYPQRSSHQQQQLHHVHATADGGSQKLPGRKL